MPPKQPPSYVRYVKNNKNVVGYNYDEINSDRSQVGNEPLGLKTRRIDEKTDEIK